MREVRVEVPFAVLLRRPVFSFTNPGVFHILVPLSVSEADFDSIDWHDDGRDARRQLNPASRQQCRAMGGPLLGTAGCCILLRYYRTI